ncbi:hypothetical protein BH10ACT1_BH10ACT1_16340 [soil metagenome]
MSGRSSPPGGGRRRGGPTVGAVVTGTIVGQAKRGVLVELGAVEVLLPRSRYGAASDRIEEAGYGDALTVEVVAEPGQPGGTGLSRVGIERSLRQPRAIAGTIRRQGLGFELVPADGAAAFAVVLLDRFAAEELVGRPGDWLVGAPHRDVRFVLVDGT